MVQLVLSYADGAASLDISSFSRILGQASSALYSRAVDLLWDMVADVEETDSSRLDWLAPHFANVVAMLQVPAFTNNPAADHTQAENALAAVSSVAEQAYQFLRRRKLLLYPDNIWDGCMASVINSLATLAANKGLKALSRPGMQHVRSMVAQPEAAQFVLRILLTLPVVSEAKKGVKLVLDVFMLLYRGQGQCILSGCGECLKPESNYPCSLRLAVLNAMDSVANSYLDECGENDAAILALWPAEALDMVIFTLAHDHSLRNRRAAMSLLTTVVVEKKTAKETALLRAILQRCRDQDLLIREHASAMLAQFGSSSLRAVLQHSDWCTLLDIGLAEGQQAGSAHPHLDSPKHAPVEQAGSNCKPDNGQYHAFATAELGYFMSPGSTINP
ncbi:hypothetical protein WJX72_008913 [[Myrmecia] bisecta]|uniref:Uncharacterized protein n=1 Tax=[Myrmecia] bisecta TaxID=41462 RepID=A0AAW1Q410_9CHLO